MKAKSKPTKLPDKPSQLIRVALRDLEKCERSRLYHVDMLDWHRPNGHCRVCLAGAVMAKSLGVPHNIKISPFDFEGEVMQKLRALNFFRCGFYDEAFYVLEIKRPEAFPDEANITDYADDKAQFKRDMRKLASLLAKEGL